MKKVQEAAAAVGRGRLMEIARKAREHTRGTGHDNRLSHRKVVEYNAYGTGARVAARPPDGTGQSS